MPVREPTTESQWLTRNALAHELRRYLGREAKSEGTLSAQGILNLKQNILVADKPGANEFSMAHWARFVMECGFTSRSVQRTNVRAILVLLLPTREFASLFAALGIILGSLRSTRDSLTWQQLLSLEEGTELFVRFTHKRKAHSLKGIVKEKGDESFGAYCKIRLTSGPKSIRDSDQFVIERNFSRLAISMTEHPRIKDHQRIIKAGTFLKQVSPDYQPNWMVAAGTEGLVVTTRAHWERTTQSVRVKPWDAKESTAIADVLLSSSFADHHLSRIAVSPVGRDISSIAAPVAVLDGPRALLHWRETSARNLIVVCGNKDFDDEMQSEVFDLAAARDDALIPNEYRSLANQAPRGIGISAFATTAP